jgi:hypothetical protein
MTPLDTGERVRHCGSCKKNVYNLSSMTREEAETLLLAKEGRLCVRYFQRTDGTILLKDCTIGVKRRRRRRIFAAGVAATLAGAGGATALLVHRGESTVEAMGDVAAAPEHEIMGRYIETPGDATMGQVAIDPPTEMKGELEPVKPARAGHR